MEVVVLKSAPKLRRIVLAAFPAYRNHSAFVCTFPADGMTLATLWDGRSGASYILVNLATGRTRVVGPNEVTHYDQLFDGLRPKLNALPAGHALVHSGVNNGHTAMAHVYLNPADAFTAFPE